jgi:hypothetical protein
MFGANRYTLRFEPRQSVPPADTLWSLTLFEFLPSEGLVGISPIHHGEIDSSMLPRLQRDEDGGFTIYIQPDLPSQNLESNWLCTQNGQFMVLLRLFWTGRPTTAVTWKIPRVLRMN